MRAWYVVTGATGGASMVHAPRTRVLVAAPVAADRAALAALLRRAGHHVDSAPDVEGAFTLLRRRPFDLAVVDARDPGLRDAVRRFRAALPPGVRLAVVALADPGPGSPASPGADVVLPVPVGRELLGVLRRCVWGAAGTP